MSFATLKRRILSKLNNNHKQIYSLCHCGRRKAIKLYFIHKTLLLLNIGDSKTGFFKIPSNFSGTLSANTFWLTIFQSKHFH